MTYKRIISFAKRNWLVKSSTQEKVGPGPNYFSNSSQSVWVDKNGFLHLKIKKINQIWHSAEVVLTQSLGYGRYILYTTSRIDLLDKNLVLGIFTYDYTAYQVNFRQLDIEVSRWGNDQNYNGQFVVQTEKPINKMLRFPISINGNYTSHVIDWNPQRVYFEMLHGHYNYAPSENYIIKQWTFVEYPVQKGIEKFIINLWQMSGMAPSNGEEAEVVIKNFEFIPK